jgi:hypothetical protein
MPLPEALRTFQLTRPPADFSTTPIRTTHCCASTTRACARRRRRIAHAYEDALSVYRDARASSDKTIEFRPKFGESPLYEHHTTSLVFNDAPLHTRCVA